MAELKEYTRPAADRDNVYVEFECCNLRSDEDPAVFKWELENLLAKTDLSLPADAKKALVARQYMRCLPRTLKFKLLEQNPARTIDEMLSFTQRYGAVEGYVLKVVIIKD